ncbi:MAG: ABC transporter substrate-binding protein [Rhodospirillaceae bacterium]
MARDIPITIAVGDTDRVGAIKDGRVKVEGCDVTFIPMEPEEVFFRAFRYNEFDCCELSFSSFIRVTSQNKSNFVGIPAFISRVFRHSGFYIRTDRGIEKPEDLRGKLVGLPEYQMTAPVWMRGILEDEYGVKPTDIRWRSGGQEQAGRDERTPFDAPAGLDLKPIPQDRTLVEMFEAGELDALMTARAPSSFMLGKPNVARLFPNFRDVEKEYYRKTKMFPIMHLVGLKKELAEKHPWMPGSIYKAFLQARDLAYEDLLKTAALNITLPWVEAEARETMALMGKDFWRYGVEESRHEIEALARYSYSHGLSERLVTPEELFAPSTFEISKI